jgi:hypothetical protein
MELFTDLHQYLAPRFTQYQIHLDRVNDACSVTDLSRTPAAVFVRPASEALNIERMMGSETRRLTLNRHPVIEVRPVADGLAIELVLAPTAWWYQQNLIGKLSIERHMSAFHRLIARMSDVYRLGFWAGAALDDMHLTPRYLIHRPVLAEWLKTYSGGRDFFRVGAWYDDAAAVSPSQVFEHVRELAVVHDFIAWSSNNDFRMFYGQQATHA